MTRAAFDELAFAHRQHLAADQPGQAHPAEERQHRDQGDELHAVELVEVGGEAVDQDGGQRQRAEQEREGQAHVDHERDDPVEPAAAEAGDQADDDADEGRQDRCRGRHLERGAGAVEPLGRQVVARCAARCRAGATR